MNQLSIDILNFINELKQPTNSDVLIEHFKSNRKEDVLEGLELLCGATASSGYIVWHKPTRSDYPNYDRLQITPKGKEIIGK